MLPATLKFHSGGFTLESTLIEWKDGELHHQLACGDFVHEQLKTTVPTAEDWAKFWRDVEKIGVWNWAEEYYTPILDGWQWSLELEHEGRKLKCSGSNDCPGGKGRSGAFAQFQRALFRLAKTAKTK